MSRWRHALVLLLAACVLAGCGMFGGGPKASKPGWDKLDLVAAAGANANSALAVDVVLVRDQTLLALLLKLKASEYFEATASLQASYPDGMAVLAFEITPCQVIHVERDRYRAAKVWGALVFARYAAPGDHRQSLVLDQPAYLVQLDAQGFSATRPPR